MKPQVWILVAGMLGASGTALGAAHAHGLENWLAERQIEESEIIKRLDQCGTGVQYQMFHATALLAIGIWCSQRPARPIQVAAGLMLAGVLCFSGGLYLMVFAGTALHWSIVPFGGLLLIGSWIAVAVGGLGARG